MAFPAIGALPQLIQLGAAAEAAGSALAGNIADFLQAMTARLSAKAKPAQTTASAGKEAVPQTETLPLAAPGFVRGKAHADLTVLNQQTQILLKRFHSELRTALEAAGIDLSPGLQLSLDGFGNLRVAGDHPQAGQIEDVLANAPHLRALFEQIAARSRLLGSAAGSVAVQAVQQAGLKSSSALPSAITSQERAARFSLIIDADSVQPLLSN